MVMGLFTLAGSFALFVSMETFRGTNFRSDRDTLIATLQHARAEAINNICLGSGCTNGRAHGVKILPNNTLVLFQGASYLLRDAAVDSVFSVNIATTTGASEFVFSQLSATSTASTVNVTDDAGHVSTTNVSAEGQIAWTN